MKELRPASELRKEHDSGEDQVFKDVWSKVVQAINDAHSTGKTSCSLQSIVKPYNLKYRVNNKLESMGYKTSQYSDYRDSYYNVSW